MFACFAWELRGFFLRPTAYIALLTMALIAGVSFWGLLSLLAGATVPALRQGDDPIVQFVGPNVFLVGSITLLIPLLTMSLVADERRRGTWEALVTTPVTIQGVMAGKYLAAWSLLLVTISPWFYYLLVLRSWGAIPWIEGTGVAFDLGPTCGAALGLVLISLTLTALGLFCSTICRSPITAAVLSFAAMLVVLILSVLPRAMALWNASYSIVKWTQMFSLWGQFEQFSQGLIDPRVIVGHLTACAVLFWVTTRRAHHCHNVA